MPLPNLGYHNTHNVRALPRSFAQVAGEINTNPAGIVITLDALDPPQRLRVLRGLCAGLSQPASTFPGTEIPVIYEVVVAYTEAAIYPRAMSNPPMLCQY